jgi:hypothetical protein
MQVLMACVARRRFFRLVTERAVSYSCRRPQQDDRMAAIQGNLP